MKTNTKTTTAPLVPLSAPVGVSGVSLPDSTAKDTPATYVCEDCSSTVFTGTVCPYYKPASPVDSVGVPEPKSDLAILKEKADAANVDVLVSLVSGSAKPVLPEHRKQIECEDDMDGIWYTEDHMAYARIPAVVLPTKKSRFKYHAIRKVSWDELWHALYMQGDRETWDRVSKDRADEISQDLSYHPHKFEESSHAANLAKITALTEALSALKSDVEFALSESNPDERLRHLELMFLGHTPTLRIVDAALALSSA